MTVMDSGLISIVRNVKIVSRFHRSCHVFVIVSVTVTLYLPLSLRLPFDLCLSVGQIKRTHTHTHLLFVILLAHCPRPLFFICVKEGEIMRISFALSAYYLKYTHVANHHNHITFMAVGEHEYAVLYFLKTFFLKGAKAGVFIRCLNLVVLCLN